MADDSPEPLASIDISALDAVQLSDALARIDYPPNREESELGPVELLNSCGGKNLLMGLTHNWRFNVRGDLGDYAVAFNNGAHVRVQGSVGAGLGESMVGGSVRVHGDAGVGVGVGMTGGTIAVYGNAGDGAGSALQGGEIFVRGNVGHNAGTSALHGTLVIGGDAGHNLGDSMMDSTIFVRGSIASLGHGVAEAPLIDRDSVRLGMLLINAGIRGAAKDFRRVIPLRVYEQEQMNRGVIGHPSWR